MINRSKIEHLFGFYYRGDEIIYVSSSKQIYKYISKYKIFLRTSEKWDNFSKDFKQRKFSLYPIRDTNLLEELRQQIKSQDRVGYLRSGMYLVKNPSSSLKSSSKTSTPKSSPKKTSTRISPAVDTKFKYFRLGDRWIISYEGNEYLLSDKKSLQFENILEVTSLVWKHIPSLKKTYKNMDEFLIEQIKKHNLLNHAKTI